MAMNNMNTAARESLSRSIFEKHPNIPYTTDEWVKIAKEIAPQYDYSKVEYINQCTKVCVICKKHGEFWVNPKYFLWKNSVCPECAKEKRKMFLKYKFIEKAKSIHGDKYDYSKVEYKNSTDKVRIICKEHGEFSQTMGNHLKGVGCPKCGNLKISTVKKKPESVFLEDIIKFNGDKYDYSKLSYGGINKPIEIICHKKDENGNEHSSFFITPHSLATKRYILVCPKCRFENEGFGRRLTKDEFVERANKVHSSKYDYSKFVYKNGKTKSIIICPEHGEFLQNGESHLNGQGCPYCKRSHLENKVSEILIGSHIVFQEQKRFDWLGKQSVDFFIPSKGIAIECQGQQHYKEIFYRSKKWTKDIAAENFKIIKERDSRKRQLCEENGVELIYFLEPRFEKYETSGNKYFINVDDLIDYIKEQVPIE